MSDVVEAETAERGDCSAAIAHACGQLVHKTSRLLNLQKSLNDTIKELAQNEGVNVNGLIRAVLADSLHSGRAMKLAGAIKEIQLLQGRKKSISFRNQTL